VIIDSIQKSLSHMTKLFVFTPAKHTRPTGFCTSMQYTTVWLESKYLSNTYASRDSVYAQLKSKCLSEKPGSSCL